MGWSACATEIASAAKASLCGLEQAPPAHMAPAAKLNDYRIVSWGWTCQCVSTVVKMLCAVPARAPLAWPNQSLTTPVLLRYRMSSMASPLKSPTWTICQELSAWVLKLVQLFEKAPL